MFVPSFPFPFVFRTVDQGFRLSISYEKPETTLANYSSIAEPSGLDPLKRPPSDELSSKLLRSNPNAYFQIMRVALVQGLIKKGVISGLALGLGSCPIEAFEKETT